MKGDVKKDLQMEKEWLMERTVMKASSKKAFPTVKELITGRPEKSIKGIGW
jgi:hypothetical protein